jgi:peptidoglycan/xylan/chitin deacetylase (PgdA/CDA1 family)
MVIMRQKIKAALAVGFAGSGALALCARARCLFGRPRIHVLAYHRVVDELPDPREVNPALCISTSSFRRQMTELRAALDVLPLAEVVRVLSGERSLARDACAITFDDGYRDVALRAAPILRSLGLQAALFVPSGFVGSRKQLPHDRLYKLFARPQRGRRPSARKLSARLERAARLAFTTARTSGPAAAVEQVIAELRARELEQLLAALAERETVPKGDGGCVLGPDELRSLGDDGWEIGAHTVGHVVLTREERMSARAELTESRAAIERFTGRPCRFLAWPNGYYSEALIAEARRAGYSAALTTFDRPNSRGQDPMRIGRKCLSEAHSRLPDGRYSAALSAAHVRDLFGDLGLTRPVDGRSEPSEGSEPPAPGPLGTASGPQRDDGACG